MDDKRDEDVTRPYHRPRFQIFGKIELSKWMRSTAEREETKANVIRCVTKGYRITIKNS